MCLLVLQLTEKLRAREVDLKLFCLLIIACLLTSVVKYAFLPIALAVGIFLAFMLWRAFRGRSKQLQKALQKSHNKLTNRAKVLLLVGLLLAAGLFVQRYGVNTISYGTPMPPCHEVIGVDACMSYGPWARNYLYEADKGEFNHSPFAHTWTWLQGLHYRLFFMITGPDGGYTNYPPSPLPSAAAVLIVIFGGLAAVFYWRRVFMGRPFLVFLLLMSAVYIGVLWFENYTQFLETGRPVAINGRYLLPLLLPLAAVFGRALGIALKPWPVIRAAAAAVVILLFVQGGGIFSFILYSDEAWYWPNRTIINANNAAQKTLDPIILQGPKQY